MTLFLVNSSPQTGRTLRGKTWKILGKLSDAVTI